MTDYRAQAAHHTALAAEHQRAAAALLALAERYDPQPLPAPERPSYDTARRLIEGCSFGYLQRAYKAATGRQMPKADGYRAQDRAKAVDEILCAEYPDEHAAAMRERAALTLGVVAGRVQVAREIAGAPSFKRPTPPSGGEE